MSPDIVFKFQSGREYFNLQIESTINPLPFLKENDFAEIIDKSVEVDVNIFILNSDNREVLKKYHREFIQFDRLHELSFIDDWDNKQFFVFKPGEFSPEDYLMCQNWIRYISIKFNSFNHHLIPIHSANLQISNSNIMVTGDVNSGKTTTAFTNLVNGNSTFTDEDTLIGFESERFFSIPLPRLLQVESSFLTGEIPDIIKSNLVFDEPSDIFGIPTYLIKIPGLTKKVFENKPIDMILYINRKENYNGFKTLEIKGMEKVYLIFKNFTNFDYFQTNPDIYKYFFDLVADNYKSLPPLFQVTYHTENIDQLYKYIKEFIHEKQL